MGLRALPQEYPRGHTRSQGSPQERNQTMVKEGLMKETSYRLNRDQAVIIADLF